MIETRVIVVVEKVGSYYLKTEFRRDVRKFLADFVNSGLTTIPVRSVVDQGWSCFRPGNLTGTDQRAPLQLFGMFLDALLGKSWLKGSDVGTFGDEYFSCAQEQSQMQWISTRIHPDLSCVLTYCPSEAGFRSRRQLYIVGTVLNHVGYNFLVYLDIALIFCFRCSS